MMVNLVLKEKFFSRRFWFGFLSVLPFSMTFLIGTLTIMDYLPIILNYDDYKEEEMIIVSIDESNSPGGGQSIDGTGTVNGRNTRTYLGFDDDHWVKDILNSLGTKGADTISVVTITTQIRRCIIIGRHVVKYRKSIFLSCLNLSPSW